MKTIVEKIDSKHIDNTIIEKASDILREGGLVAFPTETVYGLGANALDTTASKKIYTAKGRPSDNPLIVHISDIHQLEALVSLISSQARVLMDKFWPGPLTLVFRKSPMIPEEITGGSDTVAIRMPSHPVALALLRKCQLPIAAPSANISGRPSPTTAAHVIEDLTGRIDMIIDGGKVDIGLESTVVDVTGERPVILRPGFIHEETMRPLVGEVAYDPALLEQNFDKKIVPRAPGMKYRHYAPKGQLLIVDGDLSQVVDYINNQVVEKEAEGLRVGIIASKQTQAHYLAGQVQVIGDRFNEGEIANHLFEILRAFDGLSVDYIYSESFSEGGFGQAIMNRLLKAAGNQRIKLT